MIQEPSLPPPDARSVAPGMSPALHCYVAHIVIGLALHNAGLDIGACPIARGK